MILKKTEAIYKVKSILDNLNGICTTNLQAEAIINELERVGMKPPQVQKLKKYKDDFRMLELIENVNEWED